jgi:hypothetical protein
VSPYTDESCATAPYDGVTVSVNKAGNGTGAVASTPAGIYCGNACTASYDVGSAITLTAIPDPAATFSGWSGGGCAGTDPCTFASNSAIVVTAAFGLASYTLTVTKSGPGTVTTVPSGINCGSVCSKAYTSGTAITLTATPSHNAAAFVGWSGGSCSGSSLTCVVSLKAATSVTATFKNGTGNRAVTALAGSGEGNEANNAGSARDVVIDKATPRAGLSITATPKPLSGVDGFGNAAISLDGREAGWAQVESTTAVSSPTAPGSPAAGQPSLIATPNPVPADSKDDLTTLSWKAGSASWGQLYVAVNDGAEQLFAQGREGSQPAPWIRPGATYSFRLYEGVEHRTLLASVDVVQAAINATSPPGVSQQTPSPAPPANSPPARRPLTPRSPQVDDGDVIDWLLKKSRP